MGVVCMVKEIISKIFAHVCTEYAELLFKRKLTNEQIFYILQERYANIVGGKVQSTALIRASIFAYLKEYDKMNEQLLFFINTCRLEVGA